LLAGFIVGTQVRWQSGGTCMAHSAFQSFARISAMLTKLKSISRLLQSSPVMTTDMEENGHSGPRTYACACIADLIAQRACPASLRFNSQ